MMVGMKTFQRKKSQLQRILRLANKTVIPDNRFGDRLFSYLAFIIDHKRLPSDSMTFNDVLYRIKTSEEILDPLRVFVSDKEFVKLYVKAVVGDEYNVPTLDIIRSVKDVDSYEFPANCCIKPTHASGRVIFRRNGEQVDREKIKTWFSVNYYRPGREANYKTLKPKVIVEPLIFGSSNVDDYKFFCFNGVPKIIQVDLDRYLEHRRKYFDADWNEQDFSIIYPKADTAVPKPENLPEMLSIAATLSKDFSFVRVDLYSDGKRLLVGEITHCAECVGGNFVPPSAEKIISNHVFR